MMTMTPEANAEVKRNLCLGFGLMAGIYLLVSFLLMFVINPPDPLVLATIMIVAFSLPLAVMAGALLTLAYPMGCWPELLRAKRLAELYGIKPDGGSRGGRMRSRWAAFGRWRID